MTRLLSVGLRLFALGWLARNVVGAVACGPMIAAAAASGGPWWAAYVALCCVAGVALNVAVPWWAYRKLQRRIG